MAQENELKEKDGYKPSAPGICSTHICDYCQTAGATHINMEGLKFHRNCAKKFNDEQGELLRRGGCQPSTTFDELICA